MTNILPIIDAPKYETTLPVSKKVVEYRPFLVKEEKIMILAESSQNEKDITKAIEQVVSNCTFGKINSNSLCTVDLEWLVLQLRSKSRGKMCELQFKCLNEVETESGKKQCGFENTIPVDVTSAELSNEETSKIVTINESIGMKLRVPPVAVLNAIAGSDMNEVDAMFATCIACIESIFNDDEVWDVDGLEKEEIDTFIESLSKKQFDHLKDWVENMPTLSIKVNYKCAACGAEDVIEVKGVENFFD